MLTHSNQMQPSFTGHQSRKCWQAKKGGGIKERVWKGVGKRRESRRGAQRTAPFLLGEGSWRECTSLLSFGLRRWGSREFAARALGRLLQPMVVGVLDLATVLAKDVRDELYSLVRGFALPPPVIPCSAATRNTRQLVAGCCRGFKQRRWSRRPHR